MFVNWSLENNFPKKIKFEGQLWIVKLDSVLSSRFSWLSKLLGDEISRLKALWGFVRVINGKSCYHQKGFKEPISYSGRKGHTFLWGNPLLAIPEALGEKAKIISHPTRYAFKALPCSPTTQALLFHHPSCSRTVHINTMPVIDLFLVSTRHSLGNVLPERCQKWKLNIGVLPGCADHLWAVTKTLGNHESAWNAWHNLENSNQLVFKPEAILILTSSWIFATLKLGFRFWLRTLAKSESVS